MKVGYDMQTDFASRIERISCKLVWRLLICIITYLAILSMFTTTQLDINEVTFYFSDNVWLIFGLLIFGIGLLYFISIYWSTKLGKLFSSDRLKWYIIGVGGILGLLWIMCTQFRPTGDAQKVWEIAQQIENNIFKEFELGGYMVKCPHQKGLLLIVYIHQLMFGQDNFLVFQLFNVVSILIIYYQLYEIVLLLYKKKDIAGKYLIALFLFFPLALYVTFVYGIIIGFMLALSAVKQQLLYFQNRKWRNMVKTVIYIILATVVKPNYQIIMIAILAFFIMDIIRTQWRSTVAVIFIIIAYVGGHWAIRTYFEQLSGIQQMDGIPAVAYMAMGLQEGDRGDGWYNGYVSRLYDKNDGIGVKIKNEANQQLKAEIGDFIRRPRYMVTFLAKKTASQWSEPTFQSFWIGQVCDSSIKSPIWVNAIVQGGVGKILMSYLNVFQSFTYVGVLIYLLLERRRIELNQMNFGLIFIGGFIFHLFWEAKGQYTIIYFTGILLYAVLGYQQIVNRLHQNFIEKRNMKKEYLWGGFILGCALLFYIITVVDTSKGRLFCLNYDDDRYAQFQEQKLQWENGLGVR